MNVYFEPQIIAANWNAYTQRVYILMIEKSCEKIVCPTSRVIRVIEPRAISN